MVRRLSQWFVSNQKTDIWDEQRLNKVHGFIVILLVIMYTCHIIASPFTKLIENNNTIVIINIVEVICLIIGISSLSAFLATLTGRTDNLFFCNANIYRSTGTIRQSNMNTFYVRDMRVEQQRSRSNRNLQKKKINDGEEEELGEEEAGNQTKSVVV